MFKFYILPKMQKKKKTVNTNMSILQETPFIMEIVRLQRTDDL